MTKLFPVEFISTVHETRLEFWSQKPNTNVFFYLNLICSDWQFFLIDHESLRNRVMFREERIFCLLLFHQIELYDTAFSEE